MPLPRTLTPIEIRILGSLLEKQQTTPDYYPLTLNALGTACNQKTSREPVSTYSDDELTKALDRLQEEKERGISIDLGFAPFKLPDGTTAGVVDVPGHERFIHNMLAGVGAVEGCLFFDVTARR